MPSQPTIRKRYLKLQQVLVVPFVVIITLAVFTTGYFAMNYSQRSILEMGAQTSQQSAIRAEEEIRTYLSSSYATNMAVKQVIKNGLLNTNDPKALESFIKNLVVDNPKSGTVGFAYKNGDYIGYCHTDSGILQKKIADTSTDSVFYTYNIERDADGVLREHKIYSRPDYDARMRPWVMEAKTSSKPVWSSVFELFSDDRLGITLSEAIYDQHGKFSGVVGTDVVLKDLDAKLNRIKISKNSLIFIVDSDGRLVSSNEVDDKRNGKLHSALQSSNELIIKAFAFIKKQYQRNQAINTSVSFDIGGKSQDYFVSYQNYEYDRGLDWFIAVVTPENDFLAHISKIKHNMMLIWLLAFAVSLLFGLSVTYLISHSIKRLQHKVATLNHGDSDTFKPITHRIKEVNDLSEAFSDMSQRLRDTFYAIQRNNELLEDKIAERTAELQQANSELFKLSHTDNLTKLANRRSLEELMIANFTSLEKGEFSNLSVLMCDIDFFKEYNDTYGHQEGDNCLQQVAQAIKNAVRRSDIAARYGGEEFVVIMPGATLKNAQRAANNIINHVQAMRLKHEKSKVAEYVTISIGIASIDSGDDIGKDATIARADHALYKAKQSGRNRYVIYTPAADGSLQSTATKPKAEKPE